MHNEQKLLRRLQLLQNALAMWREHGRMGDLAGAAQTIEGFLIRRLWQLLGQGSAGMPEDFVDELREPPIAALVS
jgi:hypothetical protein